LTEDATLIHIPRVVALRTEVAVQGAVVEIQGVRSEQLKDIQDRTLEGKRMYS
jgi:hypothetical protein